MNDYAQHQAAVSGSLEGGGILWKLIHNIQARSMIKQLSQMDDHMLRDMGVTRAEINWAASRPFSINAVNALEERSATRRRGDLLTGF